jgi:hypothetical protein
MAVSGMQIPVLQLLEQEGWMCCSGHVRMAAHGMLRYAGEQQSKVTLRCCSGHESRGVPGMQMKYVIWQLAMDIW